jgi:hypothetical protein
LTKSNKTTPKVTRKAPKKVSLPWFKSRKSRERCSKRIEIKIKNEYCFTCNGKRNNQLDSPTPAVVCRWPGEVSINDSCHPVIKIIINELSNIESVITATGITTGPTVAADQKNTERTVKKRPPLPYKRGTAPLPRQANKASE